MQNFVHVQQDDYKTRVQLKRGLKVDCYTKRQMREKYPEAGFSIVGEAADFTKKHKVAELAIDSQTWPVANPGDHGIMYKLAGYAYVGDDKYVALLKCRNALFIWMFLLTVLLGVALLVIFWTQTATGANVYNPLPDLDPNATKLTDDDSEKVVSEGGGGSVSLAYSVDATLSLSTGQIDMCFENPNASNHDLVLELYVIDSSDDSRQTMIAQSGRVAAGSGLYTMIFDAGSAQLSAGEYNAKLKVLFYNPDTGERALVESEVSDMKLSVVN